MPNFSKHIIALLVLIFVGFSAQALHIKGGWMYYTYTGKNSAGEYMYDLTVKVYRDCAPANPGQNDDVINVTAFNAETFGSAGNFSARLARVYPLNKTSYSECINPRPQVCYVILEYQASITLPASAGGYVLAFQRCCRINGIVNVIQPSNSLGNTYTISIPGTKDLPTAMENSSPIFVEKDTAIVCYNSEFELDYSASDLDGDSLVYFFTNAISGAGQNNPNPSIAPPPPYSSVPYSSVYSATNPFGTNVSINSRTGIITGRSPSSTGEFVIAVGVYEYRNGIKIAESRKELHVNVANCNIAGAKLPIRITSCDGYTVTFENLSASPAILEYYWDFGVPGITTDVSTEAKPTFTYPDTGQYVAKLVINRSSSCSDSATTVVAVYPGFFPNINIDGSCFSNPFTFTDLTRTNYGNVNYWKWNFGDPTTEADTSRTARPIYTFPSPGMYNLTLEVGSNLGCLDTLLANIEVRDKPFLNLPFKDTLICSIDSLQLNAEGTGDFYWTPNGQMLNSNTATPTVFPKDTTQYIVTLNDRGCIATDTLTVNVLDFISVDAGPNFTVCRTDAVTLNPISQALQYSWSPTATILNPNIKNAIATPVDSFTTYIVMANLGKCQDMDSVTVRTAPYPQANAGIDTILCFGTNGQLNGSIVGSSFRWSPAGIVLRTNELQSPISPRVTTQIILTVTDTLGCAKPVSDTVIVTVRPRVDVFAGRDTSAVYGQPLQLNGSSNTITNFRWSPPTALNFPDTADPIAIFREGILPNGIEEIIYTLTAATSEGCIGTDEVKVKVFKTAPTIFVPSAFTPNTDGLNDNIKPILVGMRQLDFFRIYNRLGQLVFETKTIDKGWDGQIKGLQQSTAAFVYQVQAVDYTGTVVRANGTFVLIR